MKTFRNLGTNLLASIIAAVGFLPASAYAADIITERVTITCGPLCTSSARREVEMMYAWDDLSAMLGAAYGDHVIWDSWQDDPTMYWAGAEVDTRCNSTAKALAGGANASSTLPAQKAAAESVIASVKNSMSAAAYTSFVNGLPHSAGTTTNGASYPATTPILTIGWENGTQSSFTMVQSGSGWVVGQHTGWKPKPPTETAACPV